MGKTKLSKKTTVGGEGDETSTASQAGGTTAGGGETSAADGGESGMTTEGTTTGGGGRSKGRKRSSYLRSARGAPICAGMYIGVFFLAIIAVAGFLSNNATETAVANLKKWNIDVENRVELLFPGKSFQK